MVPVPIQPTFGLRFSNAGFPMGIFLFFKDLASMIPFVCRQLGWILRRVRRGSGLLQFASSFIQRLLQHGRIALVRWINDRGYMTPVSRSTACSGLYPKRVWPSFILATLASGSTGDSHSWLESFLPFLILSIRVNSSALGVSMPLSQAILKSICR